ncbi:glutathione S-transferase [Stigmatella aurantiaca DW4/3-1]|uniref:Glutathione S-transferase n=1 Tax=Stigmatella aurantiaca (strain DW4/3-1) TaxID=378806 RepID=Q098U9_STIAD|nr:glutathione S-transferase [Stigmatella aurantiaca DW4/3-1]
MDGAARVFENAAICLYVADKYPQAKLAPKVDAPERGRYLSLLVYSTSQLEPSMADHMTGTKTLPQRGWTSYSEALDAMERELGDGPYLFGDWFTAADVMIGSMFSYQRMLGGKTGRPKLEAYVDRLAARPKGLKVG